MNLFFCNSSADTGRATSTRVQCERRQQSSQVTILSKLAMSGQRHNGITTWHASQVQDLLLDRRKTSPRSHLNSSVSKNEKYHLLLDIGKQVPVTPTLLLCGMSHHVV